MTENIIGDKMSHREDVSEEIIEIWDEFQYEHVGDIKYSEDILAHFSRPNRKNKPLAFAVLMKPIELSNNKTSEIKSVFTSPKNRNQGLMQDMMEEIEEYAKEKGIEELRIGTHPENKPMRELAEKLDYKLESLGEEYGARYVKRI